MGFMRTAYIWNTVYDEYLVRVSIGESIFSEWLADFILANTLL